MTFCSSGRIGSSVMKTSLRMPDGWSWAYAYGTASSSTRRLPSSGSKESMTVLANSASGSRSLTGARRKA